MYMYTIHAVWHIYLYNIHVHANTFICIYVAIKLMYSKYTFNVQYKAKNR